VELLAQAAIGAGKYAQGFPSFGPERRGAPVAAFSRINDKKIKVRSGIYKPDVVVVLDSSLIGLIDVIDGLKPEGKLIVNTSKTPEEIRRIPEETCFPDWCQHRSCCWMGIREIQATAEDVI
jgi:pyruvate ferredoxin oxidoreductase gamma subunit